MRGNANDLMHHHCKLFIQINDISVSYGVCFELDIHFLERTSAQDDFQRLRKLT